MRYLSVFMKKNQKISSQWVSALGFMPEISEVGRLRHEDRLFDVSMHSYLMRARPV